MSASLRCLVVLSVLVAASTTPGGCSRASPASEGERPLLSLDSEGTRVELVTRRRTLTRSAGLRGFGRGIGWEEGSVECEVIAELRATRRGHPERAATWRLETHPPRLLFMDPAACAQRQLDVTHRSCEAAGRIAFAVDDAWRVVEAFGGRLWLLELPAQQAPGECAQWLASLGDVRALLARSHAPDACDALLDAGAALDATRCVLDHGSFGVADTHVDAALPGLVDAALRGGAPSSTLVRWAAGVARGADVDAGRDLEAELYDVVLDAPADFPVFSLALDLGLASAPSRERRFAFVEAGLARCAAGHFAPWQRLALLEAARGLNDDALTESVRSRCGVDLPGAGPRFPARLLPVSTP